jgi:hypothetical protein
MHVLEVQSCFDTKNASLQKHYFYGEINGLEFVLIKANLKQV